MTKVFDFIDFITDLIDKFFTFLGQVWDLVTSFPALVVSFIGNCPPMFLTFFQLFIYLAIALFVWRLIP